MTKAESLQLDRIEKILAADLKGMTDRVTSLEIQNGRTMTTTEANSVEIAALRKANVVWSSINSALIAISGILMLALRGG
jgi:hypothetical protein